MTGKRGQLTLFVLIGLTILLTVFFLLAIRHRDDAYTGALLQPETRESVEDYVYSCLDQLALEGFQLIAAQGGLIYESQGGLTPDDDPLSYELIGQRRISYGLVNDSGSQFRPPKAEEYGSSPSEYPYPFPNTLFANLRYSDIDAPTHHLYDWRLDENDGAFGQYALPMACDPDGQNNPDADNYNVDCPGALFQPEPVRGASIQANLEHFLEHGMERCMDLEVLAEQLGAQVNGGNLDVTVIYTEESTLIDVDPDLHFTNEDGTLHIETLERRYPVRLLKAMQFTFDLLKRASKDPFFRVNGAQLATEDVENEGFTVTIAPTTRDDLSLVTVTDSYSIVDDEPWAFQFLLENRRPVLEDTASLMIPMVEGQPRAIDLPATDPDGDPLTAAIDIDDGYATASVRTFPKDTDEIRIEVTPATFTYDKVYQANLSVTDTEPSSDWQLIDLTFHAIDCSCYPDCGEPENSYCTCTDNDGDGYAIEGAYCGNIDCEDSNPRNHPALWEDCVDGMDNDCDDLADTNDPDCLCASGNVEMKFLVDTSPSFDEEMPILFDNLNSIQGNLSDELTEPLEVYAMHGYPTITYPWDGRVEGLACSVCQGGESSQAREAWAIAGKNMFTEVDWELTARKLLIIFADSAPIGGLFHLNEPFDTDTYLAAMELFMQELQANHAVVFFFHGVWELDETDNYGDPAVNDLLELMENITNRTHGEVHEIQDVNDIPDMIIDTVDDLETQCMIIEDDGTYAMGRRTCEGTYYGACS